MPLSLSKQDLVKSLSAESTDRFYDKTFSGVCFDSRIIKKDELFICLKGSIHGQQFLESAFNKGAALALVEDRTLLENHPFCDNLVSVSDSLAAFSLLASTYRKTLAMPVVAISGSMGKTSIKELSAQLLSKIAAGTFSQKSFNNHIGVPYTICSINRDDAWAVLEMGMNHAGELSALSKIAQPDISLLSCIAPVHLENFSSIREVTRAKFEILVGTKESGLLILNNDDAELRSYLKKIPSLRQRLMFYGKNKGSDFLIKDVVDAGVAGFSFSAQYQGETLDFKSNLIGIHNVYNLSAAILIALQVYPDYNRQELRAAVSEIKPANMRLNLHRLSNNKILIDDSYNSSPEALRASLNILKHYSLRGLRVAAVLGDMLELGVDAKKYHLEISKVISDVGVNLLITVGDLARDFASADAEYQHFHFGTTEDVTKCLKENDFDVVLVKGSREIGLDQVVKGLV